MRRTAASHRQNAAIEGLIAVRVASIVASAVIAALEDQDVPRRAEAWVQQVAGHEDPKTTAGYTHLAGEDLRRTMDRRNEGIDPDTLQSLLKHSDPTIRALAQTVVKHTMSDD